MLAFALVFRHQLLQTKALQIQIWVYFGLFFSFVLSHDIDFWDYLVFMTTADKAL